jgi:hypothetical protein
MNLLIRFASALLFALVVLSACAPPLARPAPTVTRRPAVVFPPTWTPTPGMAGTIGPSPTPLPTRTIGPAATPAASSVITSAQGHFQIKIPQNWITQAGQRQLLGGSGQRNIDYATYSAPGTAPQPAIFVFYKWPNNGPISNENAWEQAFAVASLVIKVCPMTLTQGGPIEIGGENGKYIGYEDGCGVQGELIGFVYEGMNFGMLIEAPKPLWEEWRPILRNIIGTLKFE